MSAPLALALTLLVVLGEPRPSAPEADTSQPPDLASLVHPLAGTERGGTFPGASLPFGMVQYSPNTDHALGGGYRHSNRTTWGFATTHLSGPGCPAMGDVVSLPTTGPVRSVDATRQKTTFSHASEQASPGYYAVDLDASHIHAELTATARTGWARFTYPSGQANVIIDPGANFRGASDASVRIVGNDTVEGSVGSWGYWHACPARGANRYTLHFAMKFDRPFTGVGTGNGSRVRRGHRTARGADAGAYVSFDAAADPRPLVAKVAISYVDAAGARRNLAEEAGGGFDFDSVDAGAREAWNDLLDRVEVSGGEDDQRETFYTALYHSLLHPNVFSDDDGRYVGFDNRVHVASAGQAHYTNFSMWDTDGSVHQLIDLVAPERVGDMVHSLLDDARQGGWLPKWPYAHYYTNEMVGDPVDSVMADALLKGLMRRADFAPAYGALLHNATRVPRSGRNSFEGRIGLDDYLNRGFVTYRDDGDHLFAGSINMEYAVQDCALALTARRLGREADWRYLVRRAKRYRHTIDRHSRSARSRRNDGSFRRPFSPRSRAGFKEGSAAQYTWLAPQDASGLAATLGGTRATLARLDRFFAHDVVAVNAASAHLVWRGGERYNPHNETDLQAPYLYDYLGQPWKTQDTVRAAETLFTTAPNGLPGSDDLGALSSWYVLSALGLYPATPGDDHYLLTSPLFDHAVLNLPRAYYPGGPVVIDAPGASAGLRYIRGASLSGAQLATSEIAHNDLTHGAHLTFALGTAPDYGWASGSRAPVSPCAADPPTADLRLHVGPGRSSKRVVRLRATLRNAGDGRATHVRVVIRVPRGWRARGGSPWTLALGPRRSATRTWTLRPRHGRRSAAVRVDVRWAGPGGRGNALRTFGHARGRLARR